VWMVPHIPTILMMVGMYDAFVTFSCCVFQREYVVVVCAFKELDFWVGVW
jgi:hypothetical protein